MARNLIFSPMLKKTITRFTHLSARIGRTWILMRTFPAFLAYRKAFLKSPYGELAVNTGLSSIFLRKYSAPYLSRRFTAEDRLFHLSHHARFINQRFPHAVFQSLKSGPIVLGMRDEDSRCSEFRLDLSLKDQLLGSSCWEGDLVLDYLFQGVRLHRMTFSILSALSFDGQEGNILFIGGSQSSGDRELKREASLFNHEIHPSTATLLGLKGLAEVLGLRAIFAVKASDQVTIHQRPGNHRSAYDDFWSIQHGVDCGDYFELPLCASPEREAPVSGGHGSRTRKKRLSRIYLKDFVMAELRRVLEQCDQHLQSKDDGLDSRSRAVVLKFPTIPGGISSASWVRVGHSKRPMDLPKVASG